MSNRKPIDRLFQEKFKDFEAKPNANVWAGIQNKMEMPQEKNKKVFPIWLRFASAAAALILLFTVGNIAFNNENLERNSNTILDTKIEKFNTSSQNTNIVSTDSLEYNKNIIAENVVVSTTASASKTKPKNNLKTSETINNLSSQYAQSKNNISTLKQNNVNANRYVVNKNNSVSSNTNNSSSLDLEKKSIINTANNSQRLAQSNSENKQNTSAWNSNDLGNTNTSSTPNNSRNSNISNNSAANNTNNTKTSPNTEAKNAYNNIMTADTAVIETNSEKEKEEQKMMEPDSANSSNTIEEALAKIEDLNEKEEEKVNRWSVNANVAPVYYNTLGKGSHIHDQFIDNEKNGETNTSYGVNVGYSINNKLKVRSGLNKLNLSYDTANVIVYENVSNASSSLDFGNIKFVPTNQGEIITVLSTNSLSVQQLNNDLLSGNLNAALSQRLSYFEVPLELEYAIVNKRFGVNLIGGVSTFILNDNDVVTEVNNRKTRIGEANNINAISFSANAGIGLDYAFNKSLIFNLEPTFKYQINAYSETSGDFRPYIIGVYTGFSYKF